MSNHNVQKTSMKDSIKNKIRSSRPSVHEQLIEENEEVNVNDYVNIYGKKREKKLKFEERFVRHTSYIEKELLEKLNQAADGEKGEKTRIINEALRNFLD